MKYITIKRRALLPSLAGGLALLLLSISLALAAGESIQRSAVGGGGGQVSGEGLRLHSAIGQPVAGAVGEALSLCSGYLCGLGAPAAPGGGDGHVVYLPFAARGN